MADELYNSIHTGPVIDAAIGRAKAGGEIDALLQMKPGDNRADNSFFLNPINQRGQTEYTAAGYCIDRWKLNAGYTLTVGAKGIKLARTGDNALALTQIVENPSDWAGQTVTFSALIDDSTARTSQRITINANETTASGVYFSADNKLAFVTMTLPEELSDLQFRFLNYRKGSDVTYKACKFEIGDKQTLAHQDENGNWVLNEIPNYAEELLKCQYTYAKEDKVTSYASMIATTTNVLQGSVKFPRTMRIKPVLTILTVRDNATGETITGNASNSIVDKNGFSYIGFNNLSNALTIGRWHSVTYEANSDI